jgi:HPt (histidine-containing phosphotransfer) domain-containing protein
MPRTFDEAALLERVDQDLEFLRETVEMLGTDGRAYMAEIRRAEGAGDAAAVSRAAHTLKGMVSNFCAVETQARAAAVERIGKGGDLSSAGPAVADLDAHLTALIAELDDYLAQRAKGS